MNTLFLDSWKNPCWVGQYQYQPGVKVTPGLTKKLRGYQFSNVEQQETLLSGVTSPNPIDQPRVYPLVI